MRQVTGALLVVIAGAALGNEWAKDQRRRIEALYQCRMLIVILQGHISYEASELADWLLEAEARMKGGFARFCRSLAGQLGEFCGQGLEVLWDACAEDTLKDSGLRSRDRRLFGEIGRSLGELDGKTQCRHLQQYLERLDLELRSAEAEVGGRCRVCRSLGLAGGLFLAILLL